MAYLFGRIVGFSAIMVICGALSLGRAKNGKKHPWLPLIIGVIIYVVGFYGASVQDRANYGGVTVITLIEHAVALVVALVFALLVRKNILQKKEESEAKDSLGFDDKL